MIVSPDQNAAKPDRHWSRYVLAGMAALLVVGAYWYIVYPKYYQYEIYLDKGPASQTASSTEVDVSFTVPIRSSVDLMVGGVEYGPWDLAGGNYTERLRLPFHENKIELRATAVHAFHEFSSTDSMIVTVKPDFPAEPTLSSSAGSISKGPLVIRGTADPNCSIEITVNGSFSGVVSADDKGQFNWKIHDLTPGEYRISALAWNAAGINGFPSQELIVKYVPIKRTLSVFVTLKKTRLESEVVLPKDDRRLADLIAGKTSFPDFLPEVFGGIAINNYELRSLFLNVTPQITTNENTTTVRASSNPHNQINLPSLNGSFALVWPADFSENDSVVINVKDYEVTSLTPAPFTINDRGATWVGKREEAEQLNLIETGIRYRPFHSPRNFVNLMQLNPYDAVPYPYAVIPGTLYGFLLLVPIVWAAWILQKFPLNGEFGKRFQGATIYLGALCFIPPIIDFFLADYLGLKPSQLIRPLFAFGWLKAIAAVFLLILILVIVILRHFGFPAAYTQTHAPNSWTRGLLHWPQALLGRFFASTILFLLIMGLLWIAIFRSEKGVDWYRLWPALIGVLLVCPLLVLPAWFARTTLPREKIKPPWAKRIGQILLGCLLLFVVFWALFGPREDTFWNYIPGLSAPEVFEFSLSKISYAFGFLGGLSLYILFFGILVALEKIDDQKQTDNSFLLGFEKLLFVSFIVGITWHFYLIPLPFLLAFLAYRYVMVSRSEHEQLNDDGLMNEVFVRRTESTIASLNELESRQDSLDKLQKKFGDGDISPAIYEKREKELRDAIAQRRTKLQYSPQGKAQTYNVRDLILGFGPYRTNWENGKHAAKYGLWLAVPFALFSAAIVFGRGDVSSTFVPLSLALQLTESVADWLILAFFFGYFFKYIKGSSGLKKGLYLTAAYTLCILPLAARDFWPSILELVLYFIPNFVYLPVLGVVAFDRCNFSQILGKEYSWKKLVKFEDNPTLLAFSSVPVTGLAVSITSLLTGGWGKLLSIIVKLAFPETPILPK